MLLLFRGDVGGQLFCGLGQQHPLRLFHDPALQGFRRVAGQNVHRFLQQDAPPSGISFTRWTVAPVTLTPRRRAASWTFSP